MKYLKIIFLAGLWSCTEVTYAQPQEADVPDNPLAGAQATADAQAIVSYWTAQKMQDAKPMPTPTVVVDALSLDSLPSNEVGGELVAPGFVRGCPPGAKTCDTAPQSLPISASLSASAAYGDLIQPMHGAKPTNPKDGPYGPFQRWREAAPITKYPKSTIGKLFFTLKGSNFVCSASVIHRSTLITAGHCNSDGAGTFATNRLFCPSWNNGQHPTRGCWAVINSKTSAGWHSGGNPDNDYACLITNPTGQKIAKKIGSVTGWLGRAWNWGPTQAERTFGYPQAAPFTGGTLQTTASTEWYTQDFRAGGQVSKIIGSDLTGGSSGGPWILGWTGGLGETADTDGKSKTDPGKNWVNGVNSHKRCLVNCNTPPTTTSGVFWQEMTSPPFRKTSAGDESEDIIQVCFNNGGT